MSYILIWKPMYGNIGHVALKVSNDLYISLWPSSPYGPGDYLCDVDRPSCGTTYDQDCLNEGGVNNNGVLIPRAHDEQIEVQGTLNKKEIEKWWNNYSEGYSGTKNCCLAVKIALEKGELKKDELEELTAKIDEIEKDFKNNAINNKGVYIATKMKRNS